jgi:hypothetical protein
MNIQGQVTSLVQKQRQGQIKVAALPNIFNDAFSMYGVDDYLGTGNAVVRLYNSSSSPQERDFTAAELTDGTYTSWYVSGTTRVYKLYDQKGVSGHDLTAGGSQSSQAPAYVNSGNYMDFAAVGYYQYATMGTYTNPQSIEDAFNNNVVSSNNTMVFSGQKKGSQMYHLPVSGRSFIGMRDTVSPVGLEQAEHRYIGITMSMFSTNIEVSGKDTSQTLVKKTETPQVTLSPNMTTYAGGVNRVFASSVVGTYFDLFVDGVEKLVGSNTTALSSQMRIGRFQFGNNAWYTKGCAFFNKRLTQDEHTRVHNIMSATY